MLRFAYVNNPPVPNGVTVKLSALDSKGQVVDLGSATSDYAGQFAISWTPTTVGMYKIFATFEGSNAYYSSYAETALSVGAASQGTTPSTGDGTGTGAGAQPDNTMLLYGILVAVIVAIIIGLLALFRKR